MADERDRERKRENGRDRARERERRRERRKEERENDIIEIVAYCFIFVSCTHKVEIADTSAAQLSVEVHRQTVVHKFND